ncbi:hypothetical protein GALMADRAFT_146778 [Galerina marginata CBS 339.88]|uniref:Uncharacterized protein n=1 Tax=Galerina marginata (strain CBS 339.88) TaxID=685588 RepID=A0A067SK13_GALM3|nr:hypothetical protein GALMADRAFT_146778 [Galerina marginata CBS 339.88]
MLIFQNSHATQSLFFSYKCACAAQCRSPHHKRVTPNAADRITARQSASVRVKSTVPLLQALYYPLSYYKGIAAFCARYMGKLFSTDEVLYTQDSETHEDWQDRLQHFIERILLNARLDESAAIGAMVLLENLYVSGAERPPYPNEAYFGYFMGAYMTANRVLASCSHPGSSQGPPSQVAGFWLDVIGDMFSQCEVQQLEFDFRSLLNADVRMSTVRFWDIKMYMYAFIRFRLYLRTRRWCWPVDDLQLPPCHDEMMERKKLFDYVRSHVPRLQSLSDREYYRLLIRERNHIYKV